MMSKQFGGGAHFVLMLVLSAMLIMSASAVAMSEGSLAAASGEPDVPAGDAGEGGLTDPSTGEGDDGSSQEGDPVDPETPVMCAVTFYVTPEDAVIVVYGEGQTYLFENGVKQEIPFGDYEYVITADGYETVSNELILTSDIEIIVELKLDADSPVGFTENTISVYTKSFILPYKAPSEAILSFTFPSGVKYNEETRVVTITGDEVTITVEMTADFENKTYSDYLTILVNVSEDISKENGIMISETKAASDEGNDRIGEVDDTRIENAYAVYLDISISGESQGPFIINITDVLKNKGFVDNIVFGYGHDEYEVLAVHFGENSVDYPEVEIIDGQVYVTVSEFSTYGFYIYLAQEHTAFDPIYPPWSEDDDYVPFPPIVVEETEDNRVEVVACAAAAVVAALMAAFLIIDRRKG